MGVSVLVQPGILAMAILVKLVFTARYGSGSGSRRRLETLRESQDRSGWKEPQLGHLAQPPCSSRPIPEHKVQERVQMVLEN